MFALSGASIGEGSPAGACRQPVRRRAASPAYVHTMWSPVAPRTLFRIESRIRLGEVCSAGADRIRHLTALYR